VNLTAINMSGTRWMTHIKALLASTAQPDSGSPELERIHFHTTSSEVWMASTNGTIATVAHTADSVESDPGGGGTLRTDTHTAPPHQALNTSSHDGMVQVIAGATLKELCQQDLRPHLTDVELLKTAITPLEGRLTIQHCVSGSLAALSDDGDLLTVIVPIRFSGSPEEGPSTRALKTWTEHLEHLI